MIIYCSACGHPDSHAVTLAPGAGHPDKCQSCPFCQASPDALDQIRAARQVTGRR